MKKRMFTIMISVCTAAAICVPALAAGGISGKTAVNKALHDAGLKKSQVRLLESDYENGIYEVEFVRSSNQAEYDYEIKKKSGKIIKKAVDYVYKNNSSRKKIGKTAARKKVAAFSGIKLSVIKKGTCTYEYDDGKGTYEVKFKKGSWRYDYEVLAPVGKIIDYEMKYVGA